jgi:hypothetical protein
MTNPLVAATLALATARAALAERRGELATEQKRFDDENVERILAIRERTQDVVAAEITLRTLSLAAFDADPANKKPAPGVEIKATKVYAIDEVAGLAWAKEKQLCLIPEALDVAAVKKLATVQALPFVSITEEPKAFIASDLDKAIVAAGVLSEAAI